MPKRSADAILTTYDKFIFLLKLPHLLLAYGNNAGQELQARGTNCVKGATGVTELTYLGYGRRERSMERRGGDVRHNPKRGLRSER